MLDYFEQEIYLFLIIFATYLGPLPFAVHSDSDQIFIL